MNNSTKCTVSRMVAAPRQSVFDILANPRAHADLDGSSTVASSESPRITERGQVFVMDMYREDLGHYRSRNIVTEFVHGERIAWAPELDRSYECWLVEQFADITTGGHTYTYALRETAGGTEVTQIYDWSGVTDPRFAAFCPFVSDQRLTETLENLARVVERAPTGTT
ncbi:SRPBCC domain-containing protein [Actinomycetospora endophytica]|uniref:SRPBCC domain-containing protein n=1 Tax=Actinomycetospora endophytica TaxID=2291215 RepID=A0ABS8PH41_9PSEU|nr:SRPBCC domain-containing protein [Actinomycetospora endophytica]MCD2196706.1 SRPBCC domain-containing protein [Actinomycetospora endophytica]